MKSIENKKKFSNRLFAGVLAASVAGTVGAGITSYNAYQEAKTAEEAMDALEFYKDAGDPMLTEEYEARVEYADEQSSDFVFALGFTAGFAAIGAGTAIARFRREEINLE